MVFVHVNMIVKTNDTSVCFRLDFLRVDLFLLNHQTLHNKTHFNTDCALLHVLLINLHVYE